MSSRLLHSATKRGLKSLVPRKPLLNTSILKRSEATLSNPSEVCLPMLQKQQAFVISIVVTIYILHSFQPMFKSIPRARLAYAK